MDVFAYTSSGIPLRPVYGPGSRGAEPPEPGSFPFTRGTRASGYQGRLWTFRHCGGFGTAEECNRRFRYLLEQGGTGLSVSFDAPTQAGYDSDDPEVSDAVGRGGVAVDSLADAEVLFDGIPLDKIAAEFRVDGTAAILLALYVAAAERRGVPRALLAGAVRNDVLEEFAARGTRMWPHARSLRLISDAIEFCAAEMPKFTALSVSGARYREAGATAVQEMAFALADGVAYCDAVLARGRMIIEDVAPRISFTLSTGEDFFEEIAKYRAGRRRWATIVRERYGTTSDSAAMFRFDCLADGVPLRTIHEPGNSVRGAYAALASVLGGAQSIRAAAWAEPVAAPSQDSAALALRTQQILAYETGVSRVVDPLGGSYFVEALTDATEAKILEIMADIDHHGGMPRAIEDGYLRRLIAEATDRRRQGIEESAGTTVDAEARELQLKRLAQVKAERDAGAVRAGLAALCRAADGTANLMPRLIDCANAYCTLGEMAAALKKTWT